MYDGEGRVADLILQPNFSSLSKLGWARNPKEKSQSGIFQSEIFSSGKDLKPGAQRSCWVPSSL